MAKRRAGDMLTGGTRDVNPQYTSVGVTESAANTFTQVTMPVPVLRGNMGGARRYQVIELLKAWFTNSTGAGASGDGHVLQLTTTSQTAMITFTNPDLIMRYEDEIIITTSGLYENKNPKEFSFTDDAGHGLIIATENLYFGIQGTSQTGALTGTCRILYRFKNIGVDEFVGLAIQQGG